MKRDYNTLSVCMDKQNIADEINRGEENEEGEIRVH